MKVAAPKKKMTLESLGEKLDRLAELMMGEFEVVGERLTALETGQERANQEIAAIKEDTRAIRFEILTIHKRLDQLQSQVDSNTGYAKEIDHLLERVMYIEKHLGIKHKVKSS